MVRFKDTNKKWFILGFAIILVTVFTFFVYKSIIWFEIDKYEQVELSPRSIDGDVINIILLGIDRKETGHDFVDAVFYLRMDQSSKTISTIALNPDIRLQDSLTIRNILNLEKGADNESGLIRLESLLEDKIALPIDRYLIFNIKAIQEISSKGLLDIKVNNESDIVDHDLKSIDGYTGRVRYDSGEIKLKEQDIIGYVGAVSDGEEQLQLERQSRVANNLFDQFGRDDLVALLVGESDGIRRGMHTDLSKKEIAKIFVTIFNSKDYAYKGGFINKETLKPSSKVGVYDSYQLVEADFDELVSNLVRSKRFGGEMARVVIMNGTDQAGVANLYARKLESAGIRVVQVGNNPKTSQGSNLFITQNKKQFNDTIRHIKYLFNDNLSVSEEDYQYRTYGDITIVVGKDIL